MSCESERSRAVATLSVVERALSEAGCDCVCECYEDDEDQHGMDCSQCLACELRGILNEGEKR